MSARMASSHAEAAATSLLLRQSRHSLQPEISSLDFGVPIHFDTIRHYAAVTGMKMAELAAPGRDGLMILRKTGGKKRYIVLLNEEIRHPGRRRFTMAHEVGHILLGHTVDDEPSEREADAFAAQLLLPRILVAQLELLWRGALTAGELADIFRVSQEAAGYRLRSLDKPCRYSRDDYSLLECCSGLLPGPNEPLISC